MKNMKYVVCAVILNDKGEVLSVSRKDNHNDAGLIGGKVDQHEILKEALYREVHEETGLSINVETTELVFGNSISSKYHL